MTARDWLDMVREASSHIEELQRELSGLLDAKRDCVPWTTGSGGGGTAHTHSDPTASRAMGRAGLDDEIATVRATLDRCVEIVGQCGAAISNVELALGVECAEVLEIYYVDCADTWTEVAWETGMSYSSVIRRRDSAIAWLDEHLVCWQSPQKR